MECTKLCQAKQSYHFTVALTISAAENLDASSKNCNAEIVARRKVSWTRYQNTYVKGRVLGTVHCVWLCCAQLWRGKRADTALIECKWRRIGSSLASILLWKVRSCCAFTIQYIIYSTVGRFIASIYDLVAHIYFGASHLGKYVSPSVVYIGYGPPYLTIYYIVTEMYYMQLP